MLKRPPVHELEFLKISNNHAEMLRRLQRIGIDAPEIIEYAMYIAKCWLTLASEHLEDARKSQGINLKRSTFSRAYYAVYNASKATRYVVNGWVSLKGEDHQSANDLPDDFPEAAEWSSIITKLYEHRLKADYDNWDDTAEKLSMDPVDVVEKAQQFLIVATTYINAKFGERL